MNDANVRIYFNFIRTTCVIHISKRSPKFRIPQQALKLISNPFTEWVNAPKEMKSTPACA